MAEELAFARKASGLVRGLSMWDAFGVGFMNQGLTPSIWVMTSLGVGVYLGGNLIWATIISMVLAGIGFPIVWGVLGGSMPRSGGEYIYNSRIIHPIVGIGESFGNAFVWILWIYVLAPWTADPGLLLVRNGRRRERQPHLPGAGPPPQRRYGRLRRRPGFRRD